MQDILIALIFGFGLVSVALLLSVLGILNDKSWLVIIGAALAVQGKKTFWAWTLLAPSFLTVFWVLGVALYYQVQ
jgi:hypothetical protein